MHPRVKSTTLRSAAALDLWRKSWSLFAGDVWHSGSMMITHSSSNIFFSMLEEECVICSCTFGTLCTAASCVEFSRRRSVWRRRSTHSSAEGEEYIYWYTTVVVDLHSAHRFDGTLLILAIGMIWTTHQSSALFVICCVSSSSTAIDRGCVGKVCA